MTCRPPGTLGVLRLLAGVAVKQLLRATRIHKLKRKPPREGRAGVRRQPTARKRKDGLAWLMVLMVPLFLFQATVMTGQAVGHLAEGAAERAVAAAAAEAPTPQQEPVVADEPRFGGRVRRRGVDLLVPDQRFDAAPRATFVGAASLLLGVLCAALLAIGFGGANASLAGGRWTQAWLMTFPVPTRALVLAKALEYGLVTLFPWLTLFPLTWQLLRALGQPAPIATAAVATLLTTLLLGAVRLWGETWLRLNFSLKVLRSVQGGCTLLALAGMALLFVVVLGDETPAWFLEVAALFGDRAVLLPVTWPLAPHGSGFVALLCGLLGTVVVFVLAVTLSTRLLRHGAMQSGGVDAGTRGAGRWRRARSVGVIGKDLLLLLRDRNFLVQALVLPIFVIGLNLFVNRGFERAAGRGVVLIAYGAGAFAVTRSCFQVLGSEGRALWMLWSLPVPLGEVVRRKLRIWSGVGLCFSAAALAAFALRDDAPIDWPRMVWDFAIAGFGVVCAAHIGGSIGMLSGVGADGQVDRQPKQRHAWLYMFFAGTYCIGLGAAQPASQLAGALVFATLAFAMWQRAVDRLPWMLDPIEEPKRLLSLFDGAVAVLVFFVLQALVVMLMALGSRGDLGAFSATKMLVAFLIAGLGALVFAALSLAGRGLDLAEHFRLRARTGSAAVGSLLLGGLAGVGTGSLGLAYVKWLRSAGEDAWFELPAAESPGPALLLLAVVAAPLIEELLFRGLVFGGLVRSVRPWLAVLWSAGLFMVVHPMHAWLPVGLMGLAAAVIVQRTGFLPAAMVTHAVYNALVVGCG
ncbi:MAG: CPBP family intramembrane metalloprotease [Planctomycetes bacterium]|nr:CPBP family intramembrane metalloprotease [Planctomycetota bacterium]